MKIFKLKKRNFIGLLCLIFMTLSANYCYASCTYYSTENNANMTMSDIVVQRDAAIGSTIGTFSVQFSTPNYANCNGSQTVSSEYVNGWVPNASYVAATNVAGVGITINDTGWLLNQSKTQTFSGIFTGKTFTYTVTLTKTGAITGGVLPTGYYGGYRLSSGSNSAYIYYLNVIRGAKITPVACSISTPNIQVPLEDVLASSLTTIGMTAKPKDFNVGLTCDVGARINAKLLGTQNSDTSAAGVLQLTGAGSAGVAQGVGIQILYNGVAKALNTNTILKTSAGGQELLPFTARYYQTKAAALVKTGSANATATLEITYQ